MIFLACLSPGRCLLKVSNWYHWVNSGTRWVRDRDLLVATNQCLTLGSGSRPAGWLLALLCAGKTVTLAAALTVLFCEYLCGKFYCRKSKQSGVGNVLNVAIISHSSHIVESHFQKRNSSVLIYATQNIWAATGASLSLWNLTSMIHL